MEEKENYQIIKKKKKTLAWTQRHNGAFKKDKSRSGLTRIGRIFCTVEIISGHPDVKNF